MPGQHVATMLANDGKIKYIHVLLFFLLVHVWHLETVCVGPMYFKQWVLLNCPCFFANNGGLDV